MELVAEEFWNCRNSTFVFALIFYTTTLLGQKGTAKIMPNLQQTMQKDTFFVENGIF